MPPELIPLANNIQELQATVQALKSDNSRLEGLVNHLTNDLNSLKVSLASLANTINNLTNSTTN